MNVLEFREWVGIHFLMTVDQVLDKRIYIDLHITIQKQSILDLRKAFSSANKIFQKSI